MRDRSVLDGSTIAADSQPTPWMTWTLVAVLVLAFIAFAGAWGPGRSTTNADAEFIEHELLFQVHEIADSNAYWQPFTAMWFHDPVAVGHLLVNLLALILFGVHYERARGSWRTLGLFVLGSLASALGAWACLLFVAQPEITVIGCSGGIFALAAALWRGGAGVFISIIGYGPWAVRRLVPIALVVTTAFLLGPSNAKEWWGIVPFVIGHFAALGAGYALMPSKIHGVQARRRRMVPVAERQPEKLIPPEQEQSDETRQRVDELLDKIQTEGMPALTEEERAFLSEASKRF